MGSQLVPCVAELDEAEARLVRSRGLPDGAEVHETDEVVFWDRAYDRREGSGLYVPQTEDPAERLLRDRAKVLAPAPLLACDLFAGCGGFTLGFLEAGLDVVCAVEQSVPAAKTYLANLGRPDCRIALDTEAESEWQRDLERARKRARRGAADPQGPDASWGDLDDRSWVGSGYLAARGGLDARGCRAFYCGDIRDVTGPELLDLAGVEHFDVICGGPPCQGLSNLNTKACLEDPRNALLWEYMRIVAEVRPGAWLMENVPQLLTVAGGALFRAIVKLGNEAGYDVAASKLDAASYGVPQYRLRAFIAGRRPGKPLTFPMPTTWSAGRYADGSDSWSYLGGPRETLPELEAEYDWHSRTWRAPMQTESPGVPRVDQDGQQDLFGEAPDAR